MATELPQFTEDQAKKIYPRGIDVMKAQIPTQKRDTDDAPETEIDASLAATGEYPRGEGQQEVVDKDHSKGDSSDVSVEDPPKQSKSDGSE